MNVTTSPTEVVFDVSGTKYRVSLSLLANYPTTMLARMTSDLGGKTAHNDDGSIMELELFIGRDSRRFKYCLDYMRDDGNVLLPSTIPKDAFLQDLEYYGFENVDESAIKTVNPPPASRPCRALAKSLRKASKNKLRSEMKKIDYKELALFCVSSISRSRSIQPDAVHSVLIDVCDKKNSTKERRYIAAHRLIVDPPPRANEDMSKDQKIFNSFLAKFGFKLKSCEERLLCIDLEVEFL
jgi:hypothetical protein